MLAKIMHALCASVEIDILGVDSVSISLAAQNACMTLLVSHHTPRVTASSCSDTPGCSRMRG
jgi:hypothetical protein